MKKLLLLFVLFALPFVMSAQMSLTFTTINVTCNSNCDGSASVVPTGGTPPYAYLWMPGAITTQTGNSLCAGVYTVTVTDNIGGTATGTCVITQPNAITVTCMPSPGPTICSGGNVSFNLTASGGVGPFTYYWSLPGATPSSSTLQSPTVVYNSPGMYNAMCTVTDANGCVGSITITITVSGGPTLTIAHVPTTCNQSTGTMTASGAMTYVWQPGNLTTATISGLPSGISYTLTGTDPSGCTASINMVSQDSCDYVWPGDANDDAVADNIDILDIGIANGATGTTRANATTTWIGQPSTPWGQTLPSGTDYKWTDCDGNGAIDPLDTNAVVLNYGMIHSNRLIPPSTNAAAPTLAISFNQDSLTAGQPGSITVSFGDTVDQATNVYGLAFRLNYDALQLSTPTFGMSGGATWLGTPGNDLMRVVLHPNLAMGYVDVAITRLDHQDVSGYGVIGQIYFTTTTNLVGTGNTSDVAASITNVTIVDATGTTQIANVSNDNVVVSDTGIITSIAPLAVTEIGAYPNPANDVLMVQIPAGQQQSVTIEDISGRIVYSQMHAGGTNAISVSGFTPGMYILRVADNAGNYSTEKITIAR